MRTLPRALLASWTLLLAAAAASAQITTQAQSVDPGTVPGNVNYQGRLQLNGAPTTGTYSMTFRIYTAASGGTPILTLGPQSVTVTQGIFGTTLALSTATLAGSAQKYLEVQVGSQILSPREPINAVPYAVVAKTLEDALSIGTATVSGVLYSSGTLRASTVSSLTGLSGVTVSTSLFIANGNLGVGTTTPLARLHVGGTAGVDGIMFPDGSIQTSAGIGSVGAVSNIGDARITGDSDLNGTGDVILVTGSNERLRIANGGGIGIGTSLPAAKLHLSGGDLQVGDAPTASTISASGYFTLASLPSAPAASRGRIYFDSTANSGQGALRVSLDGSTFVPISTGSAGVGLSAVAANAAQFTGDGTTGNPLQLRSSSVTLQGNAFNVANTLVQLDASVRLPAVDGSQLLNISDNSKVAKSGDVMSGQLILAGSTLTVQGNAFSVGGSTLVVSAGSVGIGVSAPTARLHIGGAAGVDGIRFPDGTLQTTASSAGSFVSKTGDTMTGGLSLSGSSVTIVDGNPAHPYALAVSSGTGAGGYALYVTTAGTVGIGTTRPDGELDVNGNHFFFGPGSSSPGSSAALRMVPFNNSGDQNFYFELYNAARSASGNKLIFTGFNGTQQTMVVDAQNQAVGIRTGIATPAAALDVNGGVLLRSSATWAGSAAPPVSAAGQGAIYYDSTLNKFQVSQNGGAYADLSTGGGNFVSKTGDAMIGQLTIAGSSLTVRSSGGVSPLFVSTSATLGSAGLYVDGGNNVGIGTTSPTAKLHVQASVIALTPMLRLERLGGGAGGSILFGGQNSTATLGMDNNGTVLLGSLANFPIAFHTNATDIGNALSNERMRITETGNIGIGTSSPAVLFDVNGAAQFGSGAAKSTFTALGGLFVASGSSITLSGPNGYLSSASSVTASAFFGDGSHLTGIAGGGSFVSKTGDTMSGQLTINGSSLTVRSNGATSPLFVSTSATPGTAGLYVDGNNNVGVATTSPARSLDVLGAIRSSSTAFGVPALEATAVGSGGGGSSIVAVKAYASGGSGGSNTVYGVYSTPIGGGGGGNTAIGVYSTASGAATNYAAIFSSATVLINGDAAIPFQIGTSSFTITAAGNVVSQSSVTASAFFGDGSHLTGISGGGGNFVSKTGDTMSGSLAIYNSSLTVNGAIYSTGTTGGAAFSGAGTRFLWVPSSASIRAGAVDSTQWDPSSIGGFSVAFGQNSRAAGAWSAVSGGFNGVATGIEATVGGGNTNSATGQVSTVAGGNNNTSSNTGATVGGGDTNVASGFVATVPGGQLNTASGDYSFAAGLQAKAASRGSFVWADSQGVDLTGSVRDQFLVRSQGGFYVDASSSSFGSGSVRSTFSAAGLALAPSTNLTLSGAAGNFVGQSSVTASAFFGDGSHLTGISGSLSGGTANFIPKYNSATTLIPGGFYETSSSVTYTGSAGLAVAGSTFTVGGSTFVVSGGNVGLGTASPFRKLHVSGGRIRVSESDGAGKAAVIELSSGPAGSRANVVFTGGSADDTQGDLYLRTDDPSYNVLLQAGLVPQGKVGIGATAPAALLDVNGNAQFGAGVTKSTFSSAGALSLANNAALTLAGPSGTAVGQSSITASAFFGDGSHLTGISGSLSGGTANFIPKYNGATTLIPGNFYETSSSVTYAGSAGVAVTGSTFTVGGSTLVVVSGTVGIGTASPATTLDVNGGAQFGSGAARSTFTAAGSLNLANNAVVTVSEGIFALTSNVTAGGSTKGHTTHSIFGPYNSVGGDTGALYIGAGVSADGSRNDIILYTTSCGGGGSSCNVPKLSMFADTATFAGIASVAGNSFTVGGSTFVVSGGNVGIGTTSPSSLLTLANNGALTLSGPSGNVVSQSSVTASAFFGDGSHLTGISGGGSFVSKTGDTMTGQLTLAGSTLTVQGTAFSVGTSTFVVAGGKAGIGTSSPGNILELAGNGDDNHNLRFNQFGGANGIKQGIEFEDGNSLVRSAIKQVQTSFAGGFNDLAFYNGLTNQERMRIDVNGNVGIGTSSPAALLDVNGAAQFGSGAAKSTFTAAGGLFVASGSSVTLSGSGGYLASASSVTASSFFGDGSHLTGVSGTDATKVARTGDTMTGQLTVSGSSVSIVDATTSDLYSLSVTSSSNRSAYHLVVSTSGKIGIGHSNPPAKVAIRTAVDQNLYIDTPVSAFSTGMSLATVNDAGNANTPLEIRGNPTVFTTGSVGVGTSAPSTRLHVSGGDLQVGDVNASTVSASGYITLAGLGSSPAAAPGRIFFDTSGATKALRVSLDGSTFVPISTGTAGSASDPTKVLKAGDTMTGQLTIAGSSLTVRSNASVSPLVVSTSPTPSVAAIYVDGSNNVGMGTTTPLAPLHVASASAAYPRGVINAQHTGDDNSALYVGRKSRGTEGAPAAVQSGDNIVNLFADAYDGSAYTSGGRIRLLVDGSVSAGSVPTAIEMLTGSSGTGTARLRITSAGNVGISTGVPSTLLDVNGNAQFGSGVTRSTFSSAGALSLANNAALTLSGPSGNVVGQSSITASAFFGDGSHLTGIASGLSFVSKTGDTMSGNLTIFNSSLTVNGAIYSTGTAGGAAFSGAGTRFLWIPSSAAIRAGAVGGTEWDAANIGAYSVAFGTGTIASAAYSAVGGGLSNVANVAYAAVLGGLNNTASQTAAAVGGGKSNVASGPESTIGGGDTNTANGQLASILGGFSNVASGFQATIGGGVSNASSGSASTVGGGSNNTASGQDATVPGGLSNVASGQFSFAAGQQAQASAKGSFVWADSQASALFGSTTDQFLVRSQGGFYVDASSSSFGTGASRSTFSVSGLALASNTALTLSGPIGNVVGQSSVTASAFFGDGSHLSGISGSLSGGTANFIPKYTGAAALAPGNFYETSSSVTYNGSAGMVVSANAFSVGASTLVVSGGLVGIGTSSPSSSTALHVVRRTTGSGTQPVLWISTNASNGTTAPGLDIGGIGGIPYLQAFINTAMVLQPNGGNVGIATTNPTTLLTLANNGTLTLSGPSGNVVGQSSVTASAFFGDGSHLTGIASGNFVSKTGDSMSGSLFVNNSTVTVNGPIFSTGTAGGVAFSGAGTRFMWIPSSGSIRGGIVTSTDWDAANIGPQSVAFGQDNTASGAWSTIAGGANGTAAGSYDAIGGGLFNLTSGSDSTVAGGNGNNASANHAAIGGGQSNTASAIYATIPGGAGNTASGAYSFAAGRQAAATAQGSFVWADSQGVALTGSVVDQFLIRSQGGFFVNASSSSFGSGAVRSTFSATGLALAANTNLSLSGASGNIVGQSSVTASAFFGDASHLTGIPGSANFVSKTGDAMSGSLTIYSSSLTVNGAIYSTGTTGGAAFTGAGTRFLWIPSSAAIRAGGVGGTEWDPANIGAYSVAFGTGTVASGIYSVVGGGSSNAATAGEATVSGGQGNLASGQWATVTGGINNTANGTYAVANGVNNQASGNAASVGGGNINQASGSFAFIGAGQNNKATQNFSAVLGGTNNQATAANSAVGGGIGNLAAGTSAVVPGGNANTASGQYSLAAGNQANATAQGSFVWADSQNAALVNNTTDQFLVRAQGGFYVNSTSATFTGIVVGQSSVTASAFFGDGSHLTGIAGGGSFVSKTGDIMTGGLSLSGSSMTIVDANAAHSYALAVATGAASNQYLLYVSTLGRVGISTGAPATALDVNGQVTLRDGAFGSPAVKWPGVNTGFFHSSSDDRIEFTSNSGTSLQIMPNQLRVLRGSLGTPGIVWGDATTTGFYGPSTTEIAFVASGAEIIRLQSSGRVGIGTSAPSTTLDVNGNAQFGSGVTKSTFSSAGALALANGSGLTLSGAAGTVVGQSSVTASAFFGDGSHLTGVIAAGSVSKTGDYMTGSLIVVGSTIGAAGGPIYSTGTFGGVPVSGSGTRFMWIPSSAAIRAGAVGGTEWDAANIGPFSVAFGTGTRATSSYATVAGGLSNVASNLDASVGGGANNVASGQNATVSGGSGNNATGSGTQIGGGTSNAASNSNSVVAGGSNNSASNNFAAIGGGAFNTASGQYSFVAGGNNNIASGDYSFAGGLQANAAAKGSFVWADSQGSTLTSSVQDQFLVRSQGGFYVNASSSSFGSGASRSTFSVSGLALAPNANLTLSGSGNITVSGSSATIINSSASDSFALIVTSAPNRGVYGLTVATTNYVGMGLSATPSFRVHVSENGGTSPAAMRVNINNASSGSSFAGYFVNNNAAGTPFGLFGGGGIGVGGQGSTGVQGLSTFATGVGVYGESSTGVNGIGMEGVGTGAGVVALGNIGAGVTTAYGLLSYGNYTGGTTTTAYGVYVAAPLGTVTTKYAFASESGAGNVGIGTVTPATTLQVVGDIRVGTSGTNGCVQGFGGSAIAGTCSSDLRLKKNVAPLPSALDKLIRLMPVSYEWRADEFPERHYGAGQRPSGLIAQDVEKVLPQLVGQDDKGYKVVNYGIELQMMMLKAIQELKAENDSLRKEILELKKGAK